MPSPVLLGRHLVAAARGRRLPFVLCYHGLGHETPETDPGGLMTTPQRFAAHVDTLRARGYRLVGITELWDAVARGGRAADGLGAITFDDGLAETHHLAGEILRARGATATAFLTPALLGHDHPDLPPGRRILRADEVAPLERAGFEIGAHSHDHVELPLLGADEQEAQLRRSREVLEGLVGHEVRTMAYPYGRHDETTMAAASRAGFRIACGVNGVGGEAGRWRALSVPREPVFPSTTPARVRVKAAGLYGPAQAVSIGLGRLRRRRG
jgi:peptidoglycan/xylan/chitin deacetylase (PgdA/CDA1 family)